jgi:pyrroline-5-carboxylate reductase
MGGSIARGAVASGVLQQADLLVAEVDPKRRQEIADEGFSTHHEPGAALEAEQVLLAVKPQSFPDLARSLGTLAEPRVVISIMAGLTSGAIRKALGEGARVVRVMPNTPCLVGEGMAAIALGQGANAGDETLAVKLFDALGKTVRVDESLMDAVTALSGSGPAYVFLLAEILERVGTSLGLEPDVSARLVRQTILGSATLMDRSDLDPAALREAVTSPGGTTEAALRVLAEHDIEKILAEAVTAARNRGRELEQG